MADRVWGVFRGFLLIGEVLVVLSKKPEIARKPYEGCSLTVLGMAQGEVGVLSAQRKLGQSGELTRKGECVRVPPGDCESRPHR